MKRYIAFFMVFAALFSASCEKLLLPSDDPQPPHPVVHGSPLATLLDSMGYRLDLPALAGAIISDTGIIDAQAVGCRRYEGPANVTPNDQFHLGSNTKAFTGVLIGVLIDEGHLTWNTTLSEIFPEYAGTMRSDYRNVTILDLLSHSAGFMRDPNMQLHTGTPMEQRVEVVAWAVQQPPAVSRGTNLYSNLSHIIAGAIAERLTGRPYEDLLPERVLRPIGITTAGFGPMGTVGLEDQPMQHTIHYAPIEPSVEADNHPIYHPAGSLHMSIRDWGRFIRWVLAVEAGNASLLRLETARTLTTPVVREASGGYYACGWEIVNRDWANGRTITHGGCNGWNFSTAWLAPNRRFAVIAATNIATETAVREMENGVASRLIDYYLRAR